MTLADFQLPVPADLSLFPFQVEAIRRSLAILLAQSTGTTGAAHTGTTGAAHTGTAAQGVYNACEQGLGKSAMAIVTANALSKLAPRKDQPFFKTLIVCPAVMLYVWEEEIKRWSHFAVNQYPAIHIVEAGSKEAVQALKETYATWTIVSYSLAAKANIAEALAKLKYSMLIADEAHYLKSSKALRTKAVLRIVWPTTRYRLLLSGTPMRTCVTDLYTTFKKLLPSEPTFTDFFTFAGTYAYSKDSPWHNGKDYYGLRSATAPALSKIIRDNFFIRFKKSEVLKDLPAKTFQTIHLPPEYTLPLRNKEGELAYEEQQKLMRLTLEGKPIPAVPSNLSRHAKLQGEMKVPAIAEFVENLLEQDIPVVLFGWHKSTIAMLATALSAHNPVVITGETPPSLRADYVADFQAGKTNLFIGNIVAAGVGITLTRSSTVVFGEICWDPSCIAQAADRVHRIGQANPVTIYTISANGLDASMISVVVKRVKDMAKLFNPASLTAQDYAVQ